MPKSPKWWCNTWICVRQSVYILFYINKLNFWYTKLQIAPFPYNSTTKNGVLDISPLKMCSWLFLFFIGAFKNVWLCPHSIQVSHHQFRGVGGLKTQWCNTWTLPRVHTPSLLPNGLTEPPACTCLTEAWPGWQPSLSPRGRTHRMWRGGVSWSGSWTLSSCSIWTVDNSKSALVWSSFLHLARLA